MLHDGGHVTENDNETQNEIIICEIMSCLKEYVIFLRLLCFKIFVVYKYRTSLLFVPKRNLTLCLRRLNNNVEAYTHKFNEFYI